VRRLIINADDFGLTHGVNRAVGELHLAGALTSATLMAGASASEEAIEIALSTPSLGVGCHVVLVGPEQILKRHHQPSFGAFLGQVFTGRIDSAQIEAEAGAQIALLRGRGLRLTHIDTHKHTHMFAAVLRPVLRAAKAAGITAVRNPFEPAWSLRATPRAPWTRRIGVALLRRLEPAFLRIVAEEGFVTTDGNLGILATGSLNPSTLGSLLRGLPPGTWELVTHPGYHDSDLAKTGTRLLASRNVEREALLALQQRNEMKLISFANLPEG
jgi:predicted glycoside hydrolase/deacetylase ChbG (UPF0249 family)